MDTSLIPLAAAALFFVGSHVLLSSTPLRGVLRSRLTEGGYLGLYSLIAAVAIWLEISQFNRAPRIPVWDPPLLLHWVPVGLMPLAAALLVGGLTQRNPTLVGQERLARAADPAPGMLRVTRHPVMWGIGLWALGHLAANGDGATMILFGSMALLALGGTVLIDRRKRLALGTDWERLAAVTSNLPFAAALAGRTRLPWRDLVLPGFAGILLAGLLVQIHPSIAGLPVILPGSAPP